MAAKSVSGLPCRLAIVVKPLGELLELLCQEAGPIIFDMKHKEH